MLSQRRGSCHRFLRVVLSGLLSIGLSLPPPVLALRQPTVEGAGLEELQDALGSPAAGLEEPVGRALAAGQAVVFEAGVAQIGGQAVPVPAKLRAIRDEWFGPGRRTIVVPLPAEPPALGGMVLLDHLGLPAATRNALSAREITIALVGGFSTEMFQRWFRQASAEIRRVLVTDPETSRAFPAGIPNGVVLGIPQNAGVLAPERVLDLMALIDAALRGHAPPAAHDAIIATYDSQRVLLIAA